jgi:hypothetical protein
MALGGLACALVCACGSEKEEASNLEAVSRVDSALSATTNAYGTAESFHLTGAIDRSNPFFLALGANPRTCETCHAASQGWTLSARAVSQLFAASAGLAPLFLPHDTGSSPTADLSTEAARRAAFGPTLLRRGLIRFPRTLPATAEFTVTEVFDPAGFATPAQITNFRRPTPTANEAKVANILWASGPGDVATAVAGLVGGAARFHEQRPDAVPVDQVNAARDFQLGLFFAQTVDNEAGRLDADGATGGPANLAAQPFHVGINDIQGLDPAGQPFTRKVFNLFDAWGSEAEHHQHHDGDGCGEGGLNEATQHHQDRRDQPDLRTAARAAIYRGQELFNHKEFDITGVHGINDLLGQTTVRGTCSTCHNTPNVGGHSVFRMFDVGTADPPSCGAELPLLTLQNKTTGAVRQVCDMGRGGTGVWADVGSFRAPPLRGLASRAPYFHDGQAKDIAQVIEYFNARFDIRLDRHQRRDLEAFLLAL